MFHTCSITTLTPALLTIFNLSIKRLSKFPLISWHAKCVGKNVCHFRNALIQKLKTSCSSNFVIKEIKGRTIVFNKQNFENEPFQMGFYASENQNNRNMETENKTQQDKNFKNHFYVSYAESFHLPYAV